MKTLHLRIKDKHANTLAAIARDANMVWNFLNELSHTHTVRTGKFFTSYDMQKYLSGATNEGLKLSADSAKAISDVYAARRRKAKKAKLRWRASAGPKKALGWFPFKIEGVSFRGGQLRYFGHSFSVWDSYGLSSYEIRSGNFSEDSRGRWYANLTVEAKPAKSTGTSSIGIDLGLKDFACMSDGSKIEAQRIYRGAEAALATAQRANKTKRVKAIHAQIKNRRGDFLHKLSTGLVKQHGAIFVGNVNSAKLAKTKMAKSVLDAGWSSFRTMLQYKCDHAGVLFEEVNEAHSTLTCSACGSRSGPTGLKGLGIREWSCSDCGAVHDRDTNAALNILARGHASLAEGARA
jgi:putative transposase